MRPTERHAQTKAITRQREIKVAQIKTIHNQKGGLSYDNLCTFRAIGTSSRGYVCGRGQPHWLLPVASWLLALGASAQAQTFTTLFNFDGADGANPAGPLVQSVDGDLYGTNFNGGTGCVPYGCGTFFKISPGGTLTTLYNFCPEGLPCAETGGDPWGGLTLGADGTFYGVTTYGGANGDGTLFKITSTGILTTLYNWCSQVACSDGTWN